MMYLFRHIGAAVAALFLLFGLTSHARAEKRVEVRPYLELDQVVVADLKGGSNDVLTYSSAAAGVDGSIRTRNAEARSEEHTSELQSIMRISYAVFCLKKTTKYIDNYSNQHAHTQHARS